MPSFGANTGGYSPTSLVPSSGPGGSTATQPLGTGPALSGMTPSGLKDLYHELNKTFGEGGASAIMNFLSSGAGFNQDAINNIFAALQPGFNRSQENLMEQFSTSGNRFGSGAQIGLADLESQQNLQMGEIESQMYEQSVSNYINTLLDVTTKNAGRIASSPSIMDKIGSFLNLGGTAAGGISSLISGINPGADTGILDVISSLGSL